MKQCPQCQQIYSDDTNFCLTDGATLVPVSGSFTTQTEMPTVVRQAAPTVYIPTETPPSYGGAPFIPPISSAPPESNKTNTLLIAALVGLLALIVGGAVVGLVMYGVFKTDKANTNIANNSSSADKTTKSPTPDGKSDEDERADKLKQEQDKLERDRQKLEEERKALEEKKKKTQQTPPPRSGTTAVIIDPPSNIRAAPNGTVICIARTRGTVINILGSTGVYDNNGVWYYTDYCGRQGVIHSSQIRF